MSHDERGQRASLLEQLARATDLATAIDPASLGPPGQELVEALRLVPQLIDELEAGSARIARLEQQCDELLERITLTELALQSANESRDAANLQLAEVREAATGQRNGSLRELVETVRALRSGRG